MSRFTLLRHLLVSTGGGGGGGTITFDTRFGTATDSTTGWITFGLKPGCRRVWLNSSGGNDANDGLSAANAKATLSAAAHAFNIGYTGGDQLMIAGTGGRSYTDDGSWLVFPADGDSLTYPTVAMSYDPADATNSAKYGRLLGADRPRVTAAYQSSAYAASMFTPNPVGGSRYFFIQGIEYLADVTDNGGVSFTGKFTGVGIQNTLWSRSNISFYNGQTTDTTQWGQTFHVSKSAGYGQHRDDLSGAGNASWMFVSDTKDFYFEDIAGVHCGWALSATRASDPTAGGPKYLGHGIYFAAENSGAVFRRVIGIDIAQDMFSFRGAWTGSCFVSLDNPNFMTFGGWSGSYTEAPNGVVSQLTDATVMGGVLLNSSLYPSGGGIGALNDIAPSSISNVAFFDNPLWNSGDPSKACYFSIANDNPNISVSVALDKVRGYHYADRLGTVSGAYPSSSTWTNSILDVVVPGASNSVWGGAPAGLQTRDQIVTAVLTQMGITPGADYTARKNQLVNYVLEYPDIAGQVALAIDTLGLQSLGLSPTTHPVTTAPNISGRTAPRSVY